MCCLVLNLVAGWYIKIYGVLDGCGSWFIVLVLIAQQFGWPQEHLLDLISIAFYMLDISIIVNK